MSMRRSALTPEKGPWLQRTKVPSFQSCGSPALHECAATSHRHPNQRKFGTSHLLGNRERPKSKKVIFFPEQLSALTLNQSAWQAF